MHRTQILLEEWQYELLLQEAESEGTSLAQLIRDAVSEYLQTRRRAGGEGRLSGIAGIAEDSEITGAEHDRVLYERPRRDTEDGADGSSEG